MRNSLCCIITRDWCIPLVLENIKHFKGTVHIMTDYKVDIPNVKVYPFIENVIGKRRNFLMSQCKGKYIFMMDDDVISEPWRFQKQIEFMNNNPDVNICCANRHPLFFTKTSQMVCFQGYGESTFCIRNGKGIEFENYIHRRSGSREGYKLTKRPDFKFMEGHLNVLLDDGSNITPRTPIGPVNKQIEDRLRKIIH